MGSLPTLFLSYALVYGVALTSPLWILPIAVVLLGIALFSIDLSAPAMGILGLIFGIGARAVRYKYDVPWRRAWPIIVFGLLLGVPLMFAVLNPKYQHFAP